MRAGHTLLRAVDAVARQVAGRGHRRDLTRDEVVGDEPQTVTRGKIFGGPDLGLESTDRVRFRDDTYEVDGEVMESFRQGQLHHVRAMLRRISLPS